MHDCETTQELIPDLLFGEDGARRRGALLAEVRACGACGAEYDTLAETLGLLDAARSAALPGEDFWTGYGERLRSRMAQEINVNVWGGAAGRLPHGRGEYRLTILEDAGLARRLAAELRGVAREYELTWPEFRRDPLGFAGRVAAGYGRLLNRYAARDYAVPSVLAPLCLVLLAASAWTAAENRCRFLSLFSQRCEQALAENPYRSLEVIGYVGDIPRAQPDPEREGAAGTNRGDGGGSKPKPEKAGGGGGGGREEALPTSHGKTAQASTREQILTPSVRPPLRNPALAVDPTLKGDPLLLPPDPRPIPFGDPNSASIAPSDGTGRGEGQGAGEGTGQGSGDGKGYGPGQGENTGGHRTNYGGDGPGGGGDNVDYKQIFRFNQVSRRAVITYRPEPNFTEEARRNNVTGTVRLRAVLTATGQVTNLSVLKGLPDGLTEKAIEAALRIRFAPAQKNNRPVSQWVVIEYNFNIY